MNTRSKKSFILWLVVPVLVVTLAGCSLLGMGGGPKERTIELSFTAAESLNFDGTNSNAAQVAVFVLGATDRFLGGKVETFFDADFDQTYYAEFAADTLGARIFTVRPGQTETQIIRFTPGPDTPKRLYLGVIGDFFRRPENGRERAVYALRNKSSERVTINIGENSIESITR